jgi:hypothetical protein
MKEKMTMKHPSRWILASWTALSALACCSCGNGNGIYPVHGKVLVDGAPASGATVSFIRQDATERQRHHTAQGVVLADGSFTLASPVGSGTEPGEYEVLVDWKVKPTLGSPDRLNGLYMDASKPLLHAVVKPTSNELAPFELIAPAAE